MHDLLIGSTDLEEKHEFVNIFYAIGNGITNCRNL